MGGTQAEYVVDIWSGNHRFSSQVHRHHDQRGARVALRRPPGDLGALSEVETIDDVKADIAAEAAAAEAE